MKVKTGSCGNIFNPDDRIAAIQRECFYEFEEAFKLWKKLVILMNQPRTKTKTKGLLFTAPPDSGKSTLVRQFHFEYVQNVPGAQEEDIIIFNVPQGVGAVQVFAQLCRELGIPDIPRNPRNDPVTYYVTKAAAKLRQDHRLLIVDEFQDLSEVSGPLRKRIISAFNQLINASRIPVVLVGITGANSILRDIEDDQSNLKGTFSSRFPEFSLTPWQDNEEFQGLLVSIEQDLHLLAGESPCPFYEDNLIRARALELSDGLLGCIVTLLKEAAMKIISDGLPEVITIPLLETTAKELDYPPSEREDK
ncbi:MAG TPA: TniB family NTP-binding protein [Candidatus Lokiarchaeia archaeon]|nr:TniB family NTP-binding protein [Candidatus Lokiarchaeia archaeon]